MSGDITDAEHRLRLIRQHFLAPRGAGLRADRGPRATEPAAAMRLDVYDHMAAAVDETVALAATLCDNAEPYEKPPTGQVEHVYQWLVDETPHLDDARQQVRDALIYRHSLEHAILIGEEGIIRRHPCPSCVTWGLVWDRHTERVVCWNRHCSDDDGRPTTWTLAQLAKDHIERKTRRAIRAT